MEKQEFFKEPNIVETDIILRDDVTLCCLEGKKPNLFYLEYEMLPDGLSDVEKQALIEDKFWSYSPKAYSRIFRVDDFLVGYQFLAKCTDVKDIIVPICLGVKDKEGKSYRYALSKGDAAKLVYGNNDEFKMVNVLLETFKEDLLDVQEKESLINLFTETYTLPKFASVEQRNSFFEELFDELEKDILEEQQG